MCKGVGGTKVCMESVRKDQKMMVEAWKKEKEANEFSKYHLRSAEDLDFGYSLVWDNTHLEVHARHQGRDKANEMKSWALCMAVEHRVPSCLELNDAKSL